MGQNGPKGKGIINTLSVMQMNIKKTIILPKTRTCTKRYDGGATK